jgi:hypothetical protein
LSFDARDLSPEHDTYVGYISGEPNRSIVLDI